MAQMAIREMHDHDPMDGVPMTRVRMKMEVHWTVGIISRMKS